MEREKNRKTEKSEEEEKGKRGEKRAVFTKKGIKRNIIIIIISPASASSHVPYREVFRVSMRRERRERE